MCIFFLEMRTLRSYQDGILTAFLRNASPRSTPLQNNLGEYYVMINFIQPGFLGTKRHFHEMFATPIRDGMMADASKSEVRFGKRRAYILSKKIAPLVLASLSHHRRVSSLVLLSLSGFSVRQEKICTFVISTFLCSRMNLQHLRLLPGIDLVAGYAAHRSSADHRVHRAGMPVQFWSLLDQCRHHSVLTLRLHLPILILEVQHRDF